MKKIMFLMIALLGIAFTSCTKDDNIDELGETANLVVNRESEIEEVILSLEQSDEELMIQVNEFRLINEASLEEGSFIEIKPTFNRRKAVISIQNYDINDIETRIEICAQQGDDNGCIKWIFNKLRQGCKQIDYGEFENGAWVTFDCP